MKKEKLYCATKKGTFRMMFGFSQPYMQSIRKTSDGIKEVPYITKSTIKL